MRKPEGALTIREHVPTPLPRRAPSPFVATITAVERWKDAGRAIFATMALSALALFTTGLVPSQVAHAASQAYMTVACASLGGGGANWTNPEWAESSNNAYATASVDGTVTDPLQCVNYGFRIPLTATIVGIEVNIERKSNSTASGGSRDNSVFLVKAGAAVGLNRATATTYLTADTVETHGGPADLWGTTWTPADINAANFGTVYTGTKPSAAGTAHTISVDQIQITVYYDTGSETQSQVNCASLGGGGANWTNPERAESSNNVYATASVDGTVTDPLQCLGYGFDIPSTATVLGIEVNIERKSNSTASGGSRDNSVFLVKAGAAVGLNRATATTYLTADTVETHGGPADLWGTTWTPADINDANFGAVYTGTKPSAAGTAHTISVDQIQVTVYYSTPPPAPTLLTPADGVVVATGMPLFDWTDVVDPDGDAVTYEIQADNSGCSFPSIEIGMTGLAASTFTPGAALADGTYCWRARAVDALGIAGSYSANYNVTINTVGAFNAVAVGAANGTTLKTKLAGVGFSLDLLAIKAGVVHAGYRGTVQVEIVDGASGGGVCASMTQLLNVGNVTFAAGDAGRKSVAFSYASAVANARIRMTDASVSVVSCSSDAFAIRPTAFTVTSTNANQTGASGTPAIKTGAIFNLTAASVAGYNGTPTIDNTKVAGTPTAGAIGGSFGAANPATGTATGNSFYYSEVGNFGLNADAVRDTTFTSADQASGDCVASSTSNVLSGGLYGCWTGSNAVSQTTGVSGFGRFIPDNFGVAYTTPPIFGTACGAFTYVGTPFTYPSGVMTVTARNGTNNGLTNAPTVNYAGAYVKLTNASLAQAPYDTQSGRYSRFDALGGGTTPALDTSGLPATAGDPVIGAFAGGTGTLTFSAGTGLAFARSTTAPSAPFNADIALKLNIVDTDGVAFATNPASFGSAAAGSGIAFSAGNAMRYGRLRLNNANGSQLVPLAVRVETQYWNGSSFITNSADSCTSIAPATVAMGAYSNNLTDTPTCKTALSGGGAFAGGRATLLLAAPGGPNNGGVTLTANIGASASGSTCTAVGAAPAAATTANLPHLRGRWTGATYTENPSGRATFGAYQGSEDVIHTQENF